MRQAMMVFVMFSVVGCATAEPGRDTAAGGLEIWIEPYHSGWMVRSNRPAALALFEILPNHGVGLLYPDPERDDGYIDAGNNRIMTETGALIKQHRSRYWAPTSAYYSPRIITRKIPRVVVAVACECPLNLDEIAEPGGPAKMFGSSPGVSGQSVALRLIDEVLPSPDQPYAFARYDTGGYGVRR